MVESISVTEKGKEAEFAPKYDKDIGLLIPQVFYTDKDCTVDYLIISNNILSDMFNQLFLDKTIDDLK